MYSVGCWLGWEKSRDLLLNIKARLFMTCFADPPLPKNLEMKKKKKHYFDGSREKSHRSESDH
jgi:hypothetical protein